MGKSQCCRAKVIQFGARRRQCVECRRTWRVWPRKAGRPRLRHLDRLIHQVLIKRRSLTELAHAMRLSRQALSYRFLRALKLHFKLSKPNHPMGHGDLVLLVDGLWFRFKGRPWVIYLMAFKRPADDTATFIDPVLRPGTESREGWICALQTIPAGSRENIRAIVCDNFMGSMTIARVNGWILQYCHFHLLASLHSKLGLRRPSTVGAIETRREAYELVRTALTTPDEHIRKAAEHRVRALGDSRLLPFRFSNILREFVRRLDNYRAYRNHPALRLPRTTGSMESMGRIIRDMLGRNRSLSTPETLQLWVTAYVRLRPKVACRPSEIPTK